MADPRTKLDIIYQEVLGDVSDLVGRVEALGQKLDGLSHGAAQASAAVNAASGAATAKLRAEIEKTTTTVIERLQSVVKEATAAASVVDQAARRFAFLALLTGVLGGVFGGTLAGIALYRIVNHL